MKGEGSGRRVGSPGRHYWATMTAARWRLMVILVLPGVGLLALVGCQGSGSAADHQRVVTCLNQYHLASPDPMPSDSEWSTYFQTGVTYAVPCDALTSGGQARWEVLVVAADDKTIRIYFIGGPVDDRCGLLQKVAVSEGASKVTIEIETGADPTAPGSACSAVGHNYVTQVTLAEPLAGRTLSGPNNRGLIEHL
jgi:hypothetical protein